MRIINVRNSTLKIYKEYTSCTKIKIKIRFLTSLKMYCELYFNIFLYGTSNSLNFPCIVDLLLRKNLNIVSHCKENIVLSDNCI